MGDEAHAIFGEVGVVALGYFNESLHALVAELVGLLNDGAFDFASADAIEGFLLFVEADDLQLAEQLLFLGNEQDLWSIVCPEADHAIDIGVLGNGVFDVILALGDLSIVGACFEDGVLACGDDLVRFHQGIRFFHRLQPSERCDHTITTLTGVEVIELAHENGDLATIRNGLLHQIACRHACSEVVGAEEAESFAACEQIVVNRDEVDALLGLGVVEVALVFRVVGTDSKVLAALGDKVFDDLPLFVSTGLGGHAEVSLHAQVLGSLFDTDLSQLPELVGVVADESNSQFGFSATLVGYDNGSAGRFATTQ